LSATRRTSGSTDHLHAEARLEPGDTVHVRLDAPANVMLLDDASYDAFEKGERFAYLGGWVTQRGITLWPPREGHWHVVVDLGDEPGQVSASVQVMRG